MQSADLIRYLAEFDLSLVDLTAEQVAMFLAARNVAGYVKGLEAPVGSRRRERAEAVLHAQEADRTVDLATYDTAALDMQLPTDGMEVSQIRGVEDLSRIFPIQWLLEELRPDLFYAKLAQRELFMPQWQRLAPGPPDLEEETEDRRRTDEEAAAEWTKQHAYVLLDVSSTMRDRDRRGTVARGLALEFLRHGHEQGAWLNLRPFAVEVGTLSSGEGDDEFRAMARRIVDLANLGQTRIQTALEQAVADIRGAGPCRGADIMLITDGISRLLTNPLGDEKLHTFIVGDLFEEQAESGTISTLKLWSESFHRIWTNRFAEILAPTWQDCQAAGRFLQKVLEECRADPSRFDPPELDRLLKNVRYLVREFRRLLGKRAPAPPEVRALEGELAAAERRLRRALDQAPATAGQDLPGPQQGPFSWRWSAGRSSDGPRESFGLWDYLKRLAIRAWDWTRRQYDARFRRRP